MILRNGLEQPGFALRDAGTGLIALATICETEREALELRRQMAIHHPHKPRPKVVMVEVTVKVVD
jgi:hypothetical protein